MTLTEDSPRRRRDARARAGAALNRWVLTLLVALSAACAALASGGVRADAALPDPLSLDQALEFAAVHPRLAVAAEQDVAPRPAPLFLGCHTLVFGESHPSDAGRDQAWASPLLTPLAAQQLEIMQRFFDVLLADLGFAADSEAMAVAYIQFDRARVRAELGQVAPSRVAELDANYQRIRRQRAVSEAARRLTRALLGQALGRSDAPRDLTPPALPDQAPAVPALEASSAAAQARNERIETLAARLQGDARRLLDLAVAQRALELQTRLQLLAVLAEQARSESAWRDLKLDESRTLYELEAAADLGFSMSQQTRAQRDARQVAFCQALTLAELNALRGLPPR